MAIKKLVEERDELTKVVKKKAAAKKVEAAPKKADHVLFVSANEEVVFFRHHSDGGKDYSTLGFRTRASHLACAKQTGRPL